MGNYVFFDPEVTINRYQNSAYDISYVMNNLKTMANSNNSRVYQLNDIAVEIMEKIDGTVEYGEIIRYLSDKYHDSLHDVEKKIKVFINELETYGVKLQIQDKPIKRGLKIQCFKNYYPTVASLEITNGCNLKCKHCYGEYGARKTKNLKLDDAKIIIDHLAQIKLSILEITGGDPTINPDCAEIITYAIKVGIPKVMLLTNGIRISNVLFEILRDNREHVYVQIDLHSLRDDYYDWFTESNNKLPIVKENIVKLTTAGIKVRTCAIITPGNVDELYKIGKWSYDHGAIFYAPSVVINIGRAKQNKLNLVEYTDLLTFERLRNQLTVDFPNFVQNPENTYVNNRKNCGAICSEMSIDVDGNIRLCNMAAIQNMRLNLGNVLNDTMETIYEKNRYFFDSFMGIAAPNMNNIDCKDCENKFFCHSCILRGLLKAHEISKSGSGICKWYEKLPDNVLHNIVISE